MKIAVLGGGNGSFAAAGDFALQGHDVRLWRRDTAQVEAHRAAGSRITLKDARGRHDVQLALVTSDIAAATSDAELILCPAPAFAQYDIARRLAPHLAGGQVVFLPPATFGSMIFAEAMRDSGNHAAVSFAETGTLPWLTRKHGPFEVAITIRAKRLPVGVFPLDTAGHAIEVIGRAFPGVIEPCGDALSAALMNAGPIIHPPLIVMNAGPIEHFERWDIHKEGTQAAIRGHRRARRRTHRGARRIWLLQPAFPTGASLCQRGRAMDVWPRLARSADRFRRLARADRAVGASLHAGRFTPRPVVAGFGG